MAVRSADARPSVQVPATGDDRPSWSKVGAIAAVGFVVGIAWPRLAGIRLGPGVPDTAASPSSDAVPQPAAFPAARPALPSPSGAENAAAPAVATTVTSSSAASPSFPASDSVESVVGHGSVTSCETSEGEVLKAAQCGGLAGLDAIVMPRLRRLAKCKTGSSGPSARLRFDVTVDFAHGSVTVDPGRARPTTAPDSLLACARNELSSVSVSALEHEHPRYTVAYSVGFETRQPASPAVATSAAATSSATSADAAAQVAWEVALVRDSPKTGKVVARLQRGTTVRIGTPKEGWYPVQYGDDFTRAGWVYRGAIGR